MNISYLRKDISSMPVVWKRTGLFGFVFPALLGISKERRRFQRIVAKNSVCHTSAIFR